jgi:hypothetical protein
MVDKNEDSTSATDCESHRVDSATNLADEAPVYQSSLAQKMKEFDSLFNKLSVAFSKNITGGNFKDAESYKSKVQKVTAK